MKPRIFISCVTKEFGETRERIANILERLGYEPVRQDIFGTEPGDLREMLRDKIDDCEGLLQIVGDGYGFEPPEADPEFGRISYTQFEFLYAQRRKKKTWLFFPAEACTRDVPLDQLDRPADPQHPNPDAWQAERREVQEQYRQHLEGTSHLRHYPSSDTELDLMVEQLRDEFKKLRRGFRLWQWAVLGGIVALIVGSGVFWWRHDLQFRDLRARLETAQKRDAPGSELLAEFRRRLGAMSYSTQKADPDQRVTSILAELARERGMTVDELRQRILQAAVGASERIELAGKLRRASESEATRMREIERDGYKDLAAAALAEQQYSKALERYQHALALTPQEDERQEWASLQFSMGMCHLELGVRLEGAAANDHLRASVAAYREALKVYSREQWPQDWGMTQNNLGAALRAQAGSAEGAEVARLLGEAAAAYREALMALPREQWPQDWAKTQNNYSHALLAQAEQSEGAEAARLLAEAVAACREALKVFLREQWPEDWLKTQNSLGAALRTQARRIEGAGAARLLGQAVAAYREALKVYTREQSPQAWAATQTNLGIALSDQAERSEGVVAARLLGEAVAAFMNALTIFTEEHFAYYHSLATRNLALAEEALRKLKP